MTGTSGHENVLLRNLMGVDGLALLAAGFVGARRLAAQRFTGAFREGWASS
jgi:hypothetical protein